MDTSEINKCSGIPLFNPFPGFLFIAGYLGSSSIQSFSRILIYCWISREFLYSILFLPDSYLLLDISEVYGFSIFPEPLVSYRQSEKENRKS